MKKVEIARADYMMDLKDELKELGYFSIFGEGCNEVLHEGDNVLTCRRLGEDFQDKDLIIVERTSDGCIAYSA